MTRRLGIAAAAVLVATAACSFLIPSTAGPTNTDPPAPEANATDPDSPAAETVVEDELSAGALMGLPGIELFTPVSGSGTRPILEWGAVDGAAYYMVSIRTLEGAGYWAWRTADSSVPVGGHPRLNEAAVGPRVAPGMLWSVVAFDSEDNLIAASNHRPIAP